MMGADGERITFYAGIECNVGGEDHDSGLRVKTGAGRAAGRFGQPEFDPFRSAGQAGLLVEHQARGLHVDCILAFALVGRRFPVLRVRIRRSLEIDLDFTHGAAVGWTGFQSKALP